MKYLDEPSLSVFLFYEVRLSNIILMFTLSKIKDMKAF